MDAADEAGACHERYVRRRAELAPLRPLLAVCSFTIPGKPGTTGVCMRVRSIGLVGRLSSLLADQRFLARVADRQLHAVEVGTGLVEREFAGEFAVGS